MEEETRQARFIIGMALLICVLIVLSSYFASPAVQLILPSESAQTETSETEAVSTISIRPQPKNCKRSPVLEKRWLIVFYLIARRMALLQIYAN